MNFIDRTLDFQNEVRRISPGYDFNKKIIYKSNKPITTESYISSEQQNGLSARHRIRHNNSTSSINSSTDDQLNLLANKSNSSLRDVDEQLKELEKLVRKGDIFEDYSSKIEGIASDINETLELLRSNISKMENLLQSSLSQNTHSTAHFRTILSDLKSRLKILTKTSGVILELRSKNIKKQESRKVLYSSNSSLSNRHNFYRSFDPQIHISNNPDIENNFQTTKLINRSKIDYPHSRKEAMDNVIKIISDLAQIFNRITDLVAEQDEVIMRIDENVEDSWENTKESRNNLLEYYNRISSNRSLIIKVFAIIFIFIVFFILFLT